MKRSWYLHVSSADVGQAAILVGDPARAELFAGRLTDARPVSDHRGLRTLTGFFDGVGVTVSAFGMGAPIAAIVLEELAEQGATVALRAGTAMSLRPDVAIGSFVVAQAGFRGEGTSLTYAPLGYPAVADHGLTTIAADELARRNLPHAVGVIASLDGFFTEMLARRPDRLARVTARLDELRELNVLGVDMETAALLVTGARLRVAVGAVCLITVDGRDGRTLDDQARDARERELVEVALHAVTKQVRQVRPAMRRF
jgi:uridine phosphorylase